MGDSKADSKKRKKAFYRKCAAKKSKLEFSLQPEMRGVLVTCNQHERESVMETYRLLNDAFEHLSKAGSGADDGQKSPGHTGSGDLVEPPIPGSTEELEGERLSESVKKESNGEASCSESDDDDIAKALRREAEDTAPGCPRKPKLFQQVRTGVSNCLFVQATCPTGPTQLVDWVFDQVTSSGEARSRHVMRFLPVEATCRAELEVMRVCLQGLLERFLRERPPPSKKTFTVQFKMRNYNLLQRDDVLAAAGQVMREVDSEFRTDFISPGLVLAINILKTVCCFSVLDRFIEYKKYNLQEMV